MTAVHSPDDDATTYLSATTNGQTEQYSLAAPTIPPGSTINSVTVHSRCRRSGAINCTWKNGLYLAGNITESAGQSTTIAWKNHNSALARPGGGAWSTADLANLEAYVKATNNAGIHCTSVWVIVDYTPPAAAAGNMFLVF